MKKLGIGGGPPPVWGVGESMLRGAIGGELYGTIGGESVGVLYCIGGVLYCIGGEF